MLSLASQTHFVAQAILLRIWWRFVNTTLVGWVLWNLQRSSSSCESNRHDVIPRVFSMGFLEVFKVYLEFSSVFSQDAMNTDQSHVEIPWEWHHATWYIKNRIAGNLPSCFYLIALNLSLRWSISCVWSKLSSKCNAKFGPPDLFWS